jgi:hypothetical protein
MTHTYWLPMTDEDVEWVNNPGKLPQQPSKE